MQDHVISRRAWTQEFDVDTAATPLASICLFCLLGLIISAVVLAASSDATIAIVTVALT